MRHYFDAVLHPDTGAALEGILVRVFDADDALVDIYSDENSTAIETVSGVENAAATDSDGMFSLYVTEGVYTLRFYQGDTVIKTIANVNMDIQVQRTELADTGGAALVGFIQSDTATARTVQEQLRDVIFARNYVEGDGVADDADAIQEMLDDAPDGASISFAGCTQVRMTHGTSLSGKSLTIDFAGCEILDDLDLTTYPNGTTEALFNFAGSTVASGTTDGAIARGALSFTAVAGHSLALGDTISFTAGGVAHQNISVIVNVSGDTITMDRPTAVAVATGQEIRVITPVRIVFRNASFDFNNRYGYGVWITYGQDCLVQNLAGRDLGSKFVQLDSSFESLIDNVRCVRGFDTGAPGGHGYVVRLSKSNDCTVRNVTGSKMRHVVDCASACRNHIEGCSGFYGFSSDFLTHSNGCVDNDFVDCSSYYNETSAYTFDSDNGDKYNRVQGGTVVGTPLIKGSNDGTNTFRGIDYTNGTAAMVTDGSNATHVFNNMTIKGDSALLVPSVAGQTVNVTFNYCTFDLANIIRCLGQLQSTTSNWNVTLNRCEGISRYTANWYEQNSLCTLTLNDTRFTTSVAPAVGNALIRNNGGSVKVRGGLLGWGVASAGYIFSAAVDGTTSPSFDLDGLEVKGATTSLVRWFSGSPTFILGDLERNDVPATAWSNMAITSTRGKMFRGGFTAAPATGTWSNDCRVAIEPLVAGSPIGYGRIAGAWKAYPSMAA